MSKSISCLFTPHDINKRWTYFLFQNYDTSESKLRREFEVYGPIKKVRIHKNVRMDTYEVKSDLFLGDLHTNAIESTHSSLSN